MNNNRSPNVTNYTKLINATCVDAALKAPIHKPNKTKHWLHWERQNDFRLLLIQRFSHVDVVIQLNSM